MANIVPKLNLNKTPSIVENNSLIFAKNVRLDVDNTIHKDYSIFPLTFKKNGEDSYYVYNSFIEKIYKDVESKLGKDDPNSENYNPLYNIYYDVLNTISILYNKREGDNIEGNRKFHSSKYEIVGKICDNNQVFIFIYYYYKFIENNNKDKVYQQNNSFIIIYDEKEDLFKPCNCNWDYSGGTIDGCVVNNLKNERILVIAETNNEYAVPIKCVNLNKSSIYDDISLYTQTPNIPITNIYQDRNFSYTIPNGVYQFFVRYKIRDEFYTNWFPASKEMFAGNHNSLDTNFGSVNYVNTKTDCDYSFVLRVEHLLKNHFNNYESFQIGFILSHDDSTVARAWKHFNINENITEIYFDYKALDSEEIEITDLLKPVYNIYNVGNVTNFKNKIYISNYTETDNNDLNIKNIIESQVGKTLDVSVADTFDEETSIKKYGDWFISEKVNIDNNVYISELAKTKIEDDSNVIKFSDSKPFNGEDGIISNLLNEIIARIKFKEINETTNEEETKEKDENIFNIINNVCKGGNDNYSKDFPINNSGVYSNFDWSLYIPSLETLKDPKNILDNDAYDIQFSDDIKSIIIGDKEIQINKTVTDENLTFIKNYLYNSIRYLNQNGEFVNYNLNVHKNFIIKIKRNLKYETYRIVPPDVSINKPLISIDNDNTILGGNINNDRNDFESSISKPEGIKESITVNTDYFQTITLTLLGNAKDIELSNASNLTNYTTLIPYQEYDFYIHFVKRNGEITNGIKINSKSIAINYRKNCNGVIYPVFPKIDVNTLNGNKEYVAYFYSMIHTAINSSTIFNLRNVSHGTGDQSVEGQCIELNSFLNSKYKNILCKYTIDDGTESKSTDIIGNFYHSSDSTYSRYFGNAGFILFDRNNEENKNNLKDINNLISVNKENINAYTIDNYKYPENVDIELYKCSPYYLIEEAGNVGKIHDWKNYDLQGYICNVTILDTDRTSQYYSDGSTVYIKDGYTALDQKYNSWKIKELSKYNPSSSTDDDNNTNTDKTLLRNFDILLADNDNKNIYKNSRLKRIVTIYSNYNLNYLELVEEPKTAIKTWYDRASNSTASTESSENDKSQQVFMRLFTSLTISNIYSLPSMYHNYIRKTYTNYENKTITIFNNTIRSSELTGDESNISIFTFNANDYYNIPTNRGIITNLISVGDAILVHTQDSMFKFTGSNSLQSSDGEVQMNESTPFDTGVSEVFGSDFGFAGLQVKREHIMTEVGYIFFDRDTKTLYMYSGNNQIIKISNSIEKILRNKEIDRVSFANDYYNNRFFVNIRFADKTYITLSYNLLEDVKAFVSLHDFDYFSAFNTKTKCYFVSDIKDNLYCINTNHFGYYSDLEKKDTIYPYNDYYNPINTRFGKLDTNGKSSIIDVIYNLDYETIKTLNSIQWCSNFISKIFNPTIDMSNPSTTKMAEVYTTTDGKMDGKIPCNTILIYTDSCTSEIINCNYISNDYSIDNNYMYPRWNQGRWNLNYFRNTENTNDKFNYNSGISDNSSLIEGKYFVIRFTFDNEFKLETLTINDNNKL